MYSCCRVTEKKLYVNIAARPGASKTEITGIREDRLCIRIAAVPEDGKANAELISFIAKTAGCPKRDVVLLRGEKSRIKTVELPSECSGQLEQYIKKELT